MNNLQVRLPHHQYSQNRYINNIDLKGSKIVAFGDSITELKDDKGRSYSDYIEKFYGAKVFNVGIGAHRFARGPTLQKLLLANCRDMPHWML